MSLTCSCGSGDHDWYYETADDFSVLDTTRSKRCCACKVALKPGAEVVKVTRWKPAASDADYRIHGDEVPLAPWFLCETCGGLQMAVEELGMCCDISEPIKDQIREWREMQE